jgi:putative transposase
VEETEVPAYAYCVMPDHLHLLLAPSPRCSIVDFVACLKSRLTRALWDRGCKGIIWQRSFYDHFLRRDEDLSTLVACGLNNPVRVGLVQEAKEYALSGKLTSLDGLKEWKTARANACGTWDN